ncbi:MAG: hypothetical protein SPK00_09920 [Corynebacterium glucuronolyticum]|nr:hypothetical protein [Corynebacterium glucuronolyticum]MDD7587723.1 hypothetical protein [Mycobacteriaceae bacterium]MDY5835042.1 hypothetical protein [Corynebacterium glucuronolyticum]
MRSALSRSFLAAATACAVAVSGTTVAVADEVPAASVTTARQTADGSAAQSVYEIVGWTLTAVGLAAWIAEIAYVYNFLVRHGTIQGNLIPNFPSASSDFM